MPTTLQTKFLEDSQGNKYAPVTTPNAVRWPNGDNLNDKLGDSGNITVESNSAPTSSTLTYTKDGQTKNYAVGDKIIVPNVSSESGYDVYVLLHLASGVATWGIMDSEDDRVIFRAVVYGDDANLTQTSQITASISVNGGTSSPVAGVLDTTAGNKKFVAHVSVGDSFVITFGGLTSYLTPSPISGSKTTSLAYVVSDVATYATFVMNIVLKTVDEDTSVLPATLTINKAPMSSVTATGVLNSSQHAMEYAFSSNDLEIGDTGDVYFPDISEYITPYPPFAYTISSLGQSYTFVYFRNEIVNLGLPSNNFFAVGNVGKNLSGEYRIAPPTTPGVLVSYGNVDGHVWTRTDISKETLYSVGEADDGYEFTQANYDQTTGAGLNDSYVGTTYDVARNHACYNNLENGVGVWGNSSHNYIFNVSTPTEAQLQELMDYTDREWDLNYMGTGTPGLKFMKKSDHSVHIFVPAVLTHFDVGIDDICYCIYLGTRTMYKDSQNRTYQRVFMASYDVSDGTYSTGFINSLQRYYGCPVRPVGNTG